MNTEPTLETHGSQQTWRGLRGNSGGTYRAVVAGNVHQDVRVVPAVDVPVAVPDAADQVTLQVVGMVRSLIFTLQAASNITIGRAFIYINYKCIC